MQVCSLHLQTVGKSVMNSGLSMIGVAKSLSLRDVGAWDQGMSGYVGDALDGLGYGDWDMAVGCAAICSIFRAPSSDVEPLWLSGSGFQG